ncbi:MAG: glycosyl transferase [Verrucomicrobiales bacterium]|nr:glycosyl transferase [Verrucomicrobiales bacterium]
MDLDREIPFKVCFHQPRREDRRRQASEMFRMHGLRVRRWPGADAARIRHTRGFASTRQRAYFLSALLAIREARRREQALLIFEDDVVLHDDFRDRVSELQPPDDWGILYFGCLHVSPPEKIAPNLLRVTRAMDMHAVAIRSCWFHTLLRGLRPSALKRTSPFDVLFSDLHGVIPTYAAWPNLAWQRESHSDIAGRQYSNYSTDGRQIYMAEKVAGIV